MKKVLLLVFVAMTCIGAFAQNAGDKAVGVNVSYGTDAKNIGLGVKGLYNLTDPIRFEAAANYWLKKDGVTCWDVQANAHYLFKVGDMLAIYPLGGVGYMRASVDA